jgi:hypothetical protein
MGRVINAGSLQISYWQLQQCRNCKNKLQRNYYRLHLKFPRYALYRHNCYIDVHATTSHSHYFVFQAYRHRIITSMHAMREINFISDCPQTCGASQCTAVSAPSRMGFPPLVHTSAPSWLVHQMHPCAAACCRCCSPPIDRYNRSSGWLGAASATVCGPMSQLEAVVKRSPTAFACHPD